jgi:23S rRNA pseudouridine2605 synthase
VITEGKNRQVRQMFAKIGCDVLKLQRVAIGRLTLGSLAKGEIRPLSASDIKKIFVSFDEEAIGKPQDRKKIPRSSSKISTRRLKV